MFAEITLAAKGEEGDVVTPLTHSLEGKELPPYPRDPGTTVGKEKDGDVSAGLGGEGTAEKVLESPAKVEMAKTAVEKPLPGIQREVWAWDEDVF